MASDADAAPGETHAEFDDRPGAGGPETVLVTDCSSAVGRATALAFREEGWRVYATARDDEDLDGLADRGCLTDELDVTDDADVRRVVKRVTTEAGRIDCLVNNAGYGLFGPVEEVPVAEAREQFEVNVFGPHRLVQRVLPHMRERGDGTIVTVSSVLGRVAGPGTGVYSGSKFAVEALSDALRAEVDEYGVNVVLVEPALVDTAVLGRADGEPDEEVTTEYDWVRDLFEDVLAVSEDGPGAVPPARVAAVVVNAASATMPAPRYPVGTLATLLVKARYLPDGWRDLTYRLVRRLA